MALRPVPKPASPISDEERKYLKKVEAVAQDRGVLDQAKNAAASVPKTAWRMLVDFTQREEAAMAGIWDVVQGTGEEGENIGERFIREALGGTRIGNALGLSDPSGETFGDVFEQGGMGEGGKLSDIIGDTWLTRKWDPTARGTAALGASILLAPSSWVTLGAGGAAKFAGKAGTIVASKKAQEIAGRMYLKNLGKLGKAHGVLDDAADLARTGGDELLDLEKRILTAERDAMGLQGLGGRGRQEVFLKLEREAQARVAEMAKRGKVEGLDMGRALRIGSTRWLGGGAPGFKVANLDWAYDASKSFGEAIKTGKLGSIPKAIYSDVASVDQLVNRLPRALRQNQWFRNIEERRHSLYNSADEIADRHLGEIFQGVTEKQLKDKEFVKAWQRAADDKRFLPEFAKTYGEAAGRSIARWHVVAEEMGAGAAKLDMITPEQFASVTEQGYFPRKLNLPEDTVNQFYDARRAEFAGGSMGRHEHGRVFTYLEDLRAELRRAGYDPDKVIEMNLPKALGGYIRNHVQAVAGINFAKETVAHFSPTFGNVLRNIGADIGDGVMTLPDAELKVIRDALNPFEAKRKFDVKDITQVSKLSKKAQTAFLYEVSTRIKDVDEFQDVMRSLDRVIDGLDMKELNLLREQGLGFGRIMDDLDFATHRFKTGRLKGQQYIIPKNMVQFFVDNETKLSRGLPSAALRMLKRLDLLTNTFKTSHTVLFPAFHVRNAISNVAAMAATVGLGQILNPARMARAFKIMAGDGDFTIKAANGRKYTRAQLTELFDAMDIAPNRLIQAELVGSQKSVLSKVPVLKQAEQLGSKVGMEVENFARAQYFLTMLENGVGAAESARLMKQVLFDYSDLSVTEKEFVRRVIPFYTWTRKNIELQLRNLLTRPAGSLTQVRVINNADRGPEADMLPEYMRGDLVTQLKAGPGKALFITNIDLPVSNINVLWNGGIGKTMKEQFNMVSPMLKAPLEMALNLDTFSGQSLDGRRWMGQMGPQIDNAWPEWAKEWVELKRFDSARTGKTYYTANGTKVYLLMKNLMLGRFVQEGTRTVDMAKDLFGGDTDEAMTKLFRVMSGMRWTEIDLDEAQRDRAKDRLRRLEEWMLKKGIAAEFRRVYVP